MKAKLVSGVIYPEFESPDDGTDWDDYALKYGDKKAGETLRTKLKEALLSEQRMKYEQKARELGILSSESFSEFVRPSCKNSWLIDEWLPSEGIVMMFAPSGSGKGFVALDMAFAVACEDIDEWQGQKILKHGPVIYFAGEGQLGMKKRCAGLAAARGILPDRVNMYIVKDTLSLDDENPLAGVEKAIANIGLLTPEVVLIIFNTTNCFMCGDENKTIDATKYIHACKLIIAEFQCTVETIHHTGQDSDKQNRARGSSVFKAAMDIEYRVSKDGMRINLEMTKSKDTALAGMKSFRLEKVTAPGYFTSSGESDTTCILEDAFDIGNDSLSAPEEKPKADNFSLRTFSEAAKQYGQIVQNTDGKECISVRVEDWRNVYYELSEAKTTDTKRTQFNRARKRLTEKTQMLVIQEADGEEYCILTPNGNAYELGIMVHIRNREEAKHSGETL